MTLGWRQRWGIVPVVVALVVVDKMVGVNVAEMTILRDRMIDAVALVAMAVAGVAPWQYRARSLKGPMLQRK